MGALCELTSRRFDHNTISSCFAMTWAGKTGRASPGSESKIKLPSAMQHKTVQFNTPRSAVQRKMLRLNTSHGLVGPQTRGQTEVTQDDVCCCVV